MSTWIKTVARSGGAAAISGLLLVACQDADLAGPANPGIALESRAGGVACFAKKTLSERLEFASADRAGKILGHPDDVGKAAQRLRPRRAHAHGGNRPPCRASSSSRRCEALGWTPAEQAYWSTLADRLSDAAKG
jgi:hypothetical protein